MPAACSDESNDDWDCESLPSSPSCLRCGPVRLGNDLSFVSSASLPLHAAGRRAFAHADREVLKAGDSAASSPVAQASPVSDDAADNAADKDADNPADNSADDASSNSVELQVSPAMEWNALQDQHFTLVAHFNLVGAGSDESGSERSASNTMSSDGFQSKRNTPTEWNTPMGTPSGTPTPGPYI
jgi:hypothetical protein